MIEAERLVRSERVTQLEDWLADLVERHVRRGDRHNAERILSFLREQATKSRGDADLEPQINLAVCRALAALGRYREARILAERIPDRFAAQASILGSYASEQNPRVAEFYGPG
ncbi:MAG TPA: hypothetical protein VJ725_27970 [Thermoanaerobaculia bacterium]|nr:hypothetical protein [Thermoanaerobaculia bacterium]